jgi:nitrite reductase (NADH) small subunit
MAWRRVCDSQELREGEGLEVLVDGNVVAMFRSEGSVQAIDGMCAHQGGPLARGKVANGCVTCPWHGWQYLLLNGNNATTGKAMLRAYPAKDDGLSIFIDL